MASLDPSAPFDIKRLFRRGWGGPPSSAAPNTPATPGVATPQAMAFNSLFNDVSGGASASPPVAAPVPQVTDNSADAAATPPQITTPTDLPEGVRPSSVGGIYEGKRGYAGERVFSDNPYDNGLTDRSGGMARRTPGDLRAARALLESTGGFTGRSGRAPTQPVDPNSLRETPRYNFSSAQGVVNTGTSQGAMPFSREWEQRNQAIPTDEDIDPNGTLTPMQRRGLKAQIIAANKEALAGSRVQRGVATGAGSGVTSVGATPGSTLGLGGGIPPGVNPLDYLKTVSGVQVGQGELALKGREQAVSEQKTNEDRGNKFYDDNLKSFNEDPRFKNLTPAEREQAAQIKTLIDSQNGGIDPNTTTRGRQGLKILADHLAQYTNPSFDASRRVQPGQADVTDFDVNQGGMGARLFGSGFTAKGPALRKDVATGKYVSTSPNDPNAEREETSGMKLFGRNLPPALAAAIGGEQGLGSLQQLIEAQRRRVAAASAPKGARRRGTN